MTVEAVLTVDEAAEILRIGRSAAYAAVRAGDIPSIRIGRSIRVPRHTLELMLGIPNNDEARGGESADLGKLADAGGDNGSG